MQQQSRIKILVLCLTCLAALIVSIDVTAVNIVVSTVATDLNFPLAETQWVVNAYLLIYAALIIAGGRCGDIFGDKKCLLAGLFFFFIGSIFSACAYSLVSLVLGRLIQGIGGALITPNAMSILFRVYPKNQHGFVSGVTSSLLGIGMALGPFIGGLLTQINSWRLLFIINLPFSLCIFVGIAIVMSKKTFAKKQKISKINIAGMVLLAIILFSFLSLFVNLIQLKQYFWQLMSLLVIFILSTAIFIIQQRRSDEPLINVALISNAVLRSACLLRLLYGFPIMAMIYFLSLYLQNVLNYQVISAGLMFLPFTAALVFISPWIGKLLDRYHYINTLLIGSTISIAVCWTFTHISFGTSYFEIVGLMFISGLGVSIIRPSMTTAAIKAISIKDIGLINGVSSVLTNVGGALGIAFASILISYYNGDKLRIDSVALTQAMTPLMYVSIMVFIIIMLLVVFQLKPASQQKQKSESIIHKLPGGSL